MALKFASNTDSKSKPTRQFYTERADEIELREIEWLWRDHIPLGALTILDGDPGLGKSSFTVDLAARVSTGRLMPDGSKGCKGPVLMIGSEDDPSRVVVPRLEAARANTSKVHLGHLVTGGDQEGAELISLPDHFDYLEARIQEIRPALVVIDPIMSHLGSAIDSYKDQSARTVLAELANVAEVYGCAIILVRHLAKGQGRPALHRGGGSIAFVGAARAAFLIGKNPDDDKSRVFAMTKTNFGPTVESLGFSIEAGNAPRIHWEGSIDYSADDLEYAVDRKADDGDKCPLFVAWLEKFVDACGGAFEGTASDLSESCDGAISAGSIGRLLKSREDALRERGMRVVRDRASDRRTIRIEFPKLMHTPPRDAHSTSSDDTGESS
jgi:hypothetical protein